MKPSERIEEMKKKSEYVEDKNEYIKVSLDLAWEIMAFISGIYYKYEHPTYKNSITELEYIHDEFTALLEPYRHI